MQSEYAIVEQMGHARIVGRVSEAEVCGVKLLRVTTLTDPPVIQDVHPQSLYRITWCTEEQAKLAGRWQSSPLQSLSALPASIDEDDDDHVDVDEGEDIPA